jgi:hypothetical protein
MRPVEPLFPLDPIRSQRAIKIRPHEYLPDFERSLYVDNSVLLKAEPERILERCGGTSVFWLPKHSFRETVLAEFWRLSGSDWMMKRGCLNNSIIIS